MRAEGGQLRADAPQLSTERGICGRRPNIVPGRRIGCGGRAGRGIERAHVAKEAAAVESAVRIRQAAEKEAAENVGVHELTEKTPNASVDALAEV